MNELLTINYETDNPTVSARELHEALEIDTPWRLWFPRMCEYGFKEGIDYTPYNFVHPLNNQDTTDCHLSVDMAKEICMLQRTEKGKECRTYFIQLEKAWNTPEQIFARALKMAEKVISQKDKLITEMKPKADFFDAVADSKTAVAIGDVANVLGIKGIGRNKLFDILREKKVLKDDNQPYRQFIDNGYFRVIEQKYQKNGETVITFKTLVYQKGIDYIRKIVA